MWGMVKSSLADQQKYYHNIDVLATYKKRNPPLKIGEGPWLLAPIKREL